MRTYGEGKAVRGHGVDERESAHEVARSDRPHTCGRGQRHDTISRGARVRLRSCTAKADATGADHEEGLQGERVGWVARESAVQVSCTSTME